MLGDFMAMPRDGAYKVRRSHALRAMNGMAKLSKHAAWWEARRLARGAGTKAFLMDSYGRVVHMMDYSKAKDTVL